MSLDTLTDKGSPAPADTPEATDPANLPPVEYVPRPPRRTTVRVDTYTPEAWDTNESSAVTRGEALTPENGPKEFNGRQIEYTEPDSHVVELPSYEPDEWTVDPNTGTNKVEIDLDNLPAKSVEAAKAIVTEEKTEETDQKAETKAEKDNIAKQLQRFGRAASLNFQVARIVGFKQFASFYMPELNLKERAAERYNKAVAKVHEKLDPISEHFIKLRAEAKERKTIRKAKYGRYVEARARQLQRRRAAQLAERGK